MVRQKRRTAATDIRCVFRQTRWSLFTASAQIVRTQSLISSEEVRMSLKNGKTKRPLYFILSTAEWRAETRLRICWQARRFRAAICRLQLPRMKMIIRSFCSPEKKQGFTATTTAIHCSTRRVKRLRSRLASVFPTPSLSIPIYMPKIKTVA